MHPKKSKNYRLLAEIESCFLKSPKLSAFSIPVVHRFLAVLGGQSVNSGGARFRAGGNACRRRPWWPSGPHPVTRSGGPRWRGARCPLTVRSGGSWRNARRGCRRWELRQDTPGRVVMPRNAVKGCHGFGRWERRETPGAEAIGNTQGGVSPGDGRGAVGSRSARGFLY